jgi:hypothetical protein
MTPSLRPGYLAYGAFGMVAAHELTVSTGRESRSAC